METSDKPQKKQIKKPKKHTAEDYEQQIGELTEHLQRLQAEFENYKKRAEAERGGAAALKDAPKGFEGYALWRAAKYGAEGSQKPGAHVPVSVKQLAEVGFPCFRFNVRYWLGMDFE
jgi:hypothetical protein